MVGITNRAILESCKNVSKNEVELRNRIALGLIVALLYGAFISLCPHKYPRSQGMETDLITSYVHGAYYLKEGSRLWQDLEPFKTQGTGFPLALAVLGGLFEPNQRHSDLLPGWQYFVAGKWLSLFSAMALIVLLFVWLGTKSGLIAAIALMFSPLFFELSYSGCTDVFAVVLFLWAAYSVFKNKLLLGGILYGYAVITRYEFILFLPFALWYLWKPFKFKNILMFLAPVAVLLALNFSIAEFPPSGGKYNLALHYLNDDNQPKILIFALLAHLLLICFTVFHWQTIRYFLIEIVVLTMLGSYFIVDLCWKKLWILIPIFIFNFNLWAANVETQVNRTSEIYKPIGQYVKPENSIMSLRPMLAFVNGVKWRYWPIEESNIYIYCNQQNIDFVYWGGFEMYNRSEWKEKFSTIDNALPEFIPIYYDKYGVLFYVNKADSVKSRYNR